MGRIYATPLPEAQPKCMIMPLLQFVCLTMLVEWCCKKVRLVTGDRNRSTYTTYEGTWMLMWMNSDVIVIGLLITR